MTTVSYTVYLEESKNPDKYNLESIIKTGIFRKHLQGIKVVEVECNGEV